MFFSGFRILEKQMDEQSVEITHTHSQVRACLCDGLTHKSVSSFCQRGECCHSGSYNGQLRVTHDIPLFASVCIITLRKMTFFSKQSNIKSYSYNRVWRGIYFSFQTNRGRQDNTNYAPVYFVNDVYPHYLFFFFK